MSTLLLTFQNSLSAAGFSRSVVLGGPDPSRQAMGVVLGDLLRVPADAYAVAPASVSWMSVAGRRLMPLPPVENGNLKDRMGAISREAVHLFLKARNEGLQSLALAVPEEFFFGDLDNAICVRLIFGAADIFWRIYPQNGLNHIVVAVQSPEFVLSF